MKERGWKREKKGEEGRKRETGKGRKRKERRDKGEQNLMADRS